MDVVISIQHPAHVHFYRYVVRELQSRGHGVHVFARDEPMIRTLLDAYDVDYEALPGPGSPPGPRAVGQLTYEWRLLRHAASIRPDVMTAIGGVSVAHVSTLLGAGCVVFTDTEHATLTNKLAFPLADTVCTPTYYRDDVGDKQRRYEGCHELMYLHPDRFTPDPSVLDRMDLDADQRYAVLRSVSADAFHDTDKEGFDDVEDVIESLEQTGARVLITAEGDVPVGLADRRIDVQPHRMHDLLYYADLFVGEGGTMVTESAVLGTPALYVSSLSSGVTDALAERYGLVFRHHGENRQQEGMQQAVELLEHDDEYDWERRRVELLADVEDPLDVAVEEICAAN
jgi:predicted glycosyltransferase